MVRVGGALRRTRCLQTVASLSGQKYNCAQRAHQNTLEKMPILAALSLFFGAFAAVCIFFELISRDLLSPNGRHLGTDLHPLENRVHRESRTSTSS